MPSVPMTCNDSGKLDAEFSALSWTWNINPVCVPGVVGVPDITPLLESVNPVGSVPAVFVHVYGACPPVTASDVEYDTF